ncbi:mRNA decay activator protein ZFP36L2 isoform X2 [Amia ocellicauda]|uniref:mRNA decay activator protein ZFP36L2 isoform X2 n=1 Tax=Amia ocellicauda TaxID=2972642 RepID=UPI003463ED77
MSATLLSTFYDIEMLCKQTEKPLNMNAIHINSLLDKKAVGAPVASSTTGGYSSGFYRRSSSSSLDSLTNGNQYPGLPFSAMKEGSPASTAIMNKENKHRDRAYSEGQQKPGAQVNSTRYKTELCRPFEESGACKYGDKCQFAHGYHELRSLSRHPKYKTEPCRTFHTIGFCPYGPRCHFIHNADERRQAGPGEGKAPRESCGFGHREQQQPGALGHRDRPKLHHSLSFSGFSSQHHGLDSPLLDSPTSRTPPPACSSSSASSSSCSPGFYEDALSPGSLPCVNSAFSFPGRHLLAPLAVHTQNYQAGGGAYFPPLQGPPSPPAFNLSHLQALRRLSESPVFESPPSPPDSLSDRESYASGSLSSSGSLSGSESPGLDAGRRLPIFSRLSISDD